MTLYVDDFYRWTQTQAELLRKQQFGDVDLEHLVEEIESMGKSEKRELENRLEVLTTHLLKWQFQPALRSRSWLSTIKERRRRLERHLEENPSLRPGLAATLKEVYLYAVLATERETGLGEESFPAISPYTVIQLLDPEFLPGEAV